MTLFNFSTDMDDSSGFSTGVKASMAKMQIALASVPPSFMTLLILIQSVNMALVPSMTLANDQSRGIGL